MKKKTRQPVTRCKQEKSNSEFNTTACQHKQRRPIIILGSFAGFYSYLLYI